MELHIIYQIIDEGYITKYGTFWRPFTLFKAVSHPTQKHFEKHFFSVSFYAVWRFLECHFWKVYLKLEVKTLKETLTRRLLNVANVGQTLIKHFLNARSSLIDKMILSLNARRMQSKFKIWYLILYFLWTIYTKYFAYTKFIIRF